MLEDGKDVLAMTDEVDEFAIKFMGEYAKKAFKNVTQMVDSGEEELDGDTKAVLDAVKDVLGGKVAKVKGTRKLNKHAVCMSSEGEVSLEMEKVLSAMPNANEGIKANKVLEVNLNHKVFDKLKTLDKDGEDFKDLAIVLYSQAVLMAGLELDNVSTVADKIFNLLSK